MHVGSPDIHDDNHEAHERSDSWQGREDDPISRRALRMIIGELKAVSRLDEIHRAQLISYLRTTGLRGGLLINFRAWVLKDGLHRIVLS